MACIIIYGEILWDCLPSGPRLGGAPLNVAANLSLLGHETYLVSAVGKDEFGDQALEALAKYGVRTDRVLRSEYPTGTVEVSLDDRGDASYSFTPDCAWHHMGDLMRGHQLPEGDALLYGSLANHIPENWNWLKSQFDTFSGLRFCDINLREPWTLELVQEIAVTASILKCNESEFEALSGTYASIEDTRLLRKAKKVMPAFPDKLCITFGKDGGLYFSEKNEIYRGTAAPIQVLDSIGAGDAFMAGLMSELVAELESLPENFLDRCCKLGAEAASRAGALPELS
ncbi:MAG: PfkB family carbohydrate kinase [Verrucomicrobia bacterium]|nr:PfkB family carbohydrate kinase [Verrucomicrobiota bacterium]